MISFNPLDITIIILFFGIVILIGFISGRSTKGDADDYLLSGRKVGLFLFILTNVSTWYGGILGVGEFTYRYGLASWFTQGFPYYIFALLFAIFFAKKIRSASLFTIPDKISETYGKNSGNDFCHPCICACFSRPLCFNDGKSYLPHLQYRDHSKFVHICSSLNGIPPAGRFPFQCIHRFIPVFCHVRRIHSYAYLLRNKFRRL